MVRHKAVSQTKETVEPTLLFAIKYALQTTLFIYALEYEITHENCYIIDYLIVHYAWPCVACVIHL